LLLHPWNIASGAASAAFALLQLKNDRSAGASLITHAVYRRSLPSEPEQEQSRIKSLSLPEEGFTNLLSEIEIFRRNVLAVRNSSILKNGRRVQRMLSDDSHAGMRSSTSGMDDLPSL